MGPLLLGPLMDFQDRILSVVRHSPGLGWAYSRGFLYQRLSTVQVADPGEEGTDAFTGVPRSSTSKEGDTARERALQTSSWQGQIWKKTGRRCSGDPDWGFGAIPSGRDEARDRDLHSPAEMARSEVRCCPVQRTSIKLPPFCLTSEPKASHLASGHPRWTVKITISWFFQS